MILGVDCGNYATKTSRMIHFPSKVSRTPNILKETSVKLYSEKLYIGEGTYDTEYRKINKQYLKALILYAIFQSTSEISNKIVLGLPIGQYKQDKESLRQMMLSSRAYDIEVNNIYRRIILDDVSVYPEGVAAVVGTPFRGIVIDIGGRTTDCCYVEDNYGTKKVKNPISYPIGTLNLYSDFVKVLNTKYVLELKTEDAHRIITTGLKVDSVAVDLSEGIEILRAFIERLVSDLRLEYGLRTDDVLLVGGGCELLSKAIKNRIPSAREIDNYFYANAIGLGKAGEQLWL